jgi:hypothetical protein
MRWMGEGRVPVASGQWPVPSDNYRITVLISRATLLALLALLTAAAPAAAQQEYATADTARVVRLCAGGDVTLGTNLDTAWTAHFAHKYGVRSPALPAPDALLAPLLPLFSGADLVLVNVEGAIGEGRPAYRKCGPGSTNCFALRQPVAAASALARLGDGAAVVGNLANNHAGDAGAAGLRTTARHLSEAGVYVTGADTLATVVITPRGDTVAVLGFSTSGGPDARDLAAVRRHVARAAEQYRRVVVTMHLGAEGVRAQRTRNQTEIFLGNIDRGNPVAFARAATQAGADVVIGHGPHVMRATEWRNGALVFYSLGNLVTYGPFSFAEPLNRGAVVCVAMDADGRVRGGNLYATRQQRPGRVSVDPSGRAVLLTDSLSTLDFPTSAARWQPGGVLRMPASTPPAERAVSEPR